MTLAAAQQFIQRAVNDPDMVRRMNDARDKSAVRKILDELKFNFNREEFEPAYLNLLTCCQTEAQADAVKEVKLWWDCLEYTFQ